MFIPSHPWFNLRVLNLIVPYLSESSSLNHENVGPFLVLSHKDHNSNMMNGKETGTKNIGLIPFGIVYSRKNTTQRKESTNLLHCHESTDPPSNTFPELAQPVQSTSSLSPKHPLCNHMSYKNLSPNFCVFTSQVSCMEIPKSVQDALKIPEWKEVAF